MSAEIHPFADDPQTAAWRRRLPFIDAAAWSEQSPPEKEWSIEGWMPDRQASYLTGAGSAGKSLLAQMMCTCIATGLPFLGVSTKASRSLYISCEDDEAELHRRQHAICHQLGLDMAAVSDRMKIASLVGSMNTALTAYQPRVVDHDGLGTGCEEGVKPSPLFHALLGLAITEDIGFIALDNVAHFFTGNENIRHDVATFMSLLNRLARTIAGSVLLIGHPNKAGANFSGSTAWENQTRSRLYMETPKHEDGRAIDPDVRVLRLEKSNYARNGVEISFRWHEGTFVRALDLPEHLRDTIAETAKASADNGLFLACLAERNRQERPVSETPSPNYAPTQFAKMPESKGIGKTRLEAAMDRLFRIGEIKRDFVCRDTIRRRDLHGLIEVPECASNAATNGAQTGATNRVKPEAQTATNTHPIPKGIKGAAHGQAAPYPGEAA